MASKRDPRFEFVMSAPQPIQVFEGVTEARFQAEIVGRNRPAVLKGIARDWPAVRQAAQSDDSIMRYLKRQDNGIPVKALVGSPDIEGKFFYGDSVKTFNFATRSAPLSFILDQLAEERKARHPKSIYVQSCVIRDHLLEFTAENAFPFLPGTVEPRIWIGNAITVQTHYDLNDNVAVLVAGKRHFTLFPPEQLVNLYIGPFDHTPAGSPVSMVSLDNPDFQRFPRFAEALEAALCADLEPGDGLYIPYFWWHHVRSLAPFNVLVNYWWNEGAASVGQPYNVLLHAILSLRDLPPAKRNAWKTMLDYYVFGVYGDPVGHLDIGDQGSLGPHTPELTRHLRQTLLRSLARLWAE